MIVDDLLVANEEAPAKKLPLARSIEALGKQGVSGWITSYLHVLRSLGNESTHEAHTGKTSPQSVSEEDLVINLFCIQRLWAFWVDKKLNASNSSSSIDSHSIQASEIHLDFCEREKLADEISALHKLL